VRRESTAVTRRRDKFYLSSHYPPRLSWAVAENIRSLTSDILRGSLSYEAHLENRRTVLRLPREDWPTYNSKLLWPSCLTVVETVVAAKTGWVSYPVIDPPALVTRVSRSDFNSEPELAKSIIARNILGIRSGITLPSRYCKYFRYRWNFLVLSTRRIPIGLARFLASQWIRCPSNLWLERKVTLKKFLREVPLGIVNSARARPPPFELYSEESEAGSSLSSTQYRPEDFWNG